MPNGAQNLGTQLGALLFSGNDNTSYLRGQQVGASVQSALEAARLARAKAINQEGQNSAIPELAAAAAKLGLGEDQAAGFQTLGQAGGGDAVALAKALGLVRGQGYQADARTAALGGDYNAANANLVGLADKPLDLTKIAGGQQYNPLVTPDSGQSITTPLGLADIGLRHAQAGASNASAANSYASAGEHRARSSLLGEIGGGKAPSGYRFTDTGALEPIPGGPADRKSGTAPVVISNPDGSSTIIPGGKPNTQELTNAGFYSRMVEANKILDALESSGYNPANLKDVSARHIPLGNVAMSDVGQQYQQAAMNWIRANLRKESGAAIGKDEAAQEYVNYFPQYGDDRGVIAQKAANRRNVEKAMRIAAGPAASLVMDTPPTDAVNRAGSSTGLGGNAPAPAKILKYNPVTGKIE
jgi:hypothetical protein